MILSDLQNWFVQESGLSPIIWGRLWKTLLVFICYVLLSQILLPLLTKRIEEPAKRYIINKTFRYLFGVVTAVIIILIWISERTGFAAYLGILSAGLAIALQDPITNLAGWLFIVLRRPFSLGDRIQVGEHRGDVIDIRLFMFTLVEIGNWVDADQSTGRIIHLPNGLVFRQSLANYNRGFNFIWDELPITITFESDWRKAEKLLKEIMDSRCKEMVREARRELENAARDFLVHFKILTPIIWTSVADNGVTLTLRYLCHPRERRSLASDIWKAILDTFSKEPHIDLAYPTIRYFENLSEGKKPNFGKKN